MHLEKLTHAHTYARRWLYIDHNLSFRSSVTFIHLFIGLFIYLCIHYSLDWLSFYLWAWFRGESGRTFIFWWEQSLIQNRPIPRSLPPSVSLSLSLCPSDRLSRSLSLPISPTFCHCLSLCVGLSLLCVFQSLPRYLFVSLSLALWAVHSPSCPYEVDELQKCYLRLRMMMSFQVIFIKISFHTKTPKQCESGSLKMHKIGI